MNKITIQLGKLHKKRIFDVDIGICAELLLNMSKSETKRIIKQGGLTIYIPQETKHIFYYTNKTHSPALPRQK